MDTFIITGANTEPAQSVIRRLCEVGARAYGIAGTFPANTFTHEEFFPVACDITDPQAVAGTMQKIIDTEHNLCGLILATQFLETEAFEALPPEEIAGTVNALITAPLVIARLALPALIACRGNIIAISPNTVTPRGHVLNNLMEAAMKSFTGTLFGELRDTGVRTCHILLQNNPGAQDPATQYTTAPQSRIHAEIVADTVETVLTLRENNALTQIVLRPQATRETPHIPISAEPKIRTLQVVQLPPANKFPPEEKPIYTEKYRRPDYAPKNTKPEKDVPADDDDDGLADDFVDPELRYLIKKQPENSVKNVPAGSTAPRPARKRKRHRNKKRQNLAGQFGGASVAEPPANPEKDFKNMPEKPQKPKSPRKSREPRAKKTDTPLAKNG